MDMQVLLVAGGYRFDDDGGPLSSTEVLIGDSPVWTMATPLPRALDGMASVTLDNTVFMIGKVYCTIL